MQQKHFTQIREHIKKHEASFYYNNANCLNLSLNASQLKLKQLCKGEIDSAYQNVNAKWERMVWPIEQFDMVNIRTIVNLKFFSQD